ncbi:MAG TPA: S-layer homology domain-containing protein, partial [Oscillospiraceae bacterium]|nr:S-layer homology domain-containing protein [Oscillospiraceae bacterium]
AARQVLSDNNATEAEINAAADALVAAMLAQNPAVLNPIIIGAADLRIPTGTALDLLEGVTALDVFGNDLSDRITADPETLDTSIAQTREVIYSVTDNYNRTAIKTITIEVYKPEVLKGLLEGAIAEAKAINLSLYTSSTAAILQAAITAADEVLADDEATQEQVDSAAAALTAAINALIFKPAVGPTPPGPPAEDEPVSPSFSDVTPDDWSFEYIESLYALGIVSGYGESGEFRPYNNLNRQEAAKMIAIAAGKEASKGFVSKFTDVKVNSWAFEFIAALEKHGVVSGYKGTAEFRPLKNIKRSHVSKMVVIAFGLDYGDVKKTFSDIQGADCEEFIKILASNGIVDGYKGTSIFKPNDEISRAEFAKIIDLAMKVGG